MSGRLTLRARAWVALVLPPVTWFAFEQGLSALLHAVCGAALAGVIWGVASLALCGLAMVLAWPLRAHEGALADPWLARLALVTTAFFALAIAFQTLAVVVVPPCVG